MEWLFAKKKKHRVKIPDAYKKKIEAAGLFLRERKNVLFTRSLWISLPFIIIFMIGPVALWVNGGKQVDSSVPWFVWLINGIFIWWIIAIFYSVTIREVYSVESMLWVDSFFRGNSDKISEEEIVRDARKVFWPFLGMRFLLFFNYHIWVFVYYFGSLIIFFRIMFTVGETPLINFLFWVMMLQMLLGPLIFWSYYRYLEKKLGYFWIVFLSHFGQPGATYWKMRKEMLLLNRASMDEEFKNSMIRDFGGLDADDIAASMRNILFARFRNLGYFGKAVDNSVAFISDEYENQVSGMAKMFASHILYDYARSASKEIGGNKQNIL